MGTTVRITETYDLKTEIGKLGLIGIHTPTDALLRKLYPGLMKNHRFVRFKKCDVVGACASILPADPLQVGVESGDIAPEDLFNPILMRPVTNTSFATLMGKIYTAPGAGALGSVDKMDGYSSIPGAEFNVYYALLAEAKRFKKSMPQKGFSMRGLYPLMHTLLSSYGNMSKIGNKYVLSEDGETPTSVPELGVNAVAQSGATTTVQSVVMRGRSVKMPKIPLHYTYEGDSVETINIPKTYVCAIITPPARLHSFYYRMRVTWTVSFEGVMSTNEITSSAGYAEIASSSYQGYTYESSKSEMDTKADLADSNNVELNKIIEA